MLHGDQHDISTVLRRYDGLAGVDDSELNLLAEGADVRRAERGECLLELGCEDSRQVFLLDGVLELVAGDGASHIVRHTDDAAGGPVSRLRPSRYRIVARSPVQYLLLEQQLLDGCSHPKPSAHVLVEEALPIEPTSELLDDSASHPLMFDVFDDLNRGRIMIPSDPDIALRLGLTLNGGAGDAARLAATIGVCPVLTVKVVRAAKALVRRVTPLHSIEEAVATLGEDRTFALTVNCVLRETLRTESTVVRRRMRDWWQRTVRVAAITAVLARMHAHLDVHLARLVGLLHSIAEPVMLGYADRHADLANAVALDNVLLANRAELGRILLTLWDLPRPIIEAAAVADHWGYTHEGPADYCDVLLVAQWHAMIGDARRLRAPRVEEIPAFRRLGLDPASPELSLRIVEAAERAIDEVDSLLAT